MGGGDMPTPEEMGTPEGMGAPTEGMGQAPEMGVGPSPDVIMAATSILVAAGLIPQATDQLTPEVVAAFQMLVDKIRPGLYDLSSPDELLEVLNGLANGTIGLDVAGDAAALGGDPAAGGPAGPAGPAPAGPLG
tara:strand:- start:1614 stop:2015 length:402 start_codon:yes stop_codon:yes gene_type:complete